MKRHNTIDTNNPKTSYQSRNLPHRFDCDKPVFITYRINFSLPQSIIRELAQRKSQWSKDILDLDDFSKQEKLNSQDGVFFSWFDELIADNMDLPQTLHQKDFTDIIATSFKHFDQIRYHLLAYCIMPNHVHVLINPLMQENGLIYPLSHIAYTWKRYTAAAINKSLGGSGKFWQQESYDHMLRNDYELMNVIQYIKENPVKARLVERWQDWYGTWVRVEQHADAAESEASRGDC